MIVKIRSNQNNGYVNQAILFNLSTNKIDQKHQLYCFLGTMSLFETINDLVLITIDIDRNNQLYWYP